jgi:hypothetical protein
MQSAMSDTYGHGAFYFLTTESVLSASLPWPYRHDLLQSVSFLYSHQVIAGNLIKNIPIGEEIQPRYSKYSPAFS